jgi:hypothetical protein
MLGRFVRLVAPQHRGKSLACASARAHAFSYEKEHTKFLCSILSKKTHTPAKSPQGGFMSVESLAIACLVEEGASALRTFYANGVTSSNFPIYDEEFEWIEKRLARKKTLNRRVFRQRFPDYEWAGIPKESPRDLAEGLKEERAFEEATTILNTLGERLERDNAVELLTEARERISAVTRQYAPMSSSVLEDWQDDVAEMRRYMQAAKAGAPVGLQSGFAHLDHNWGGLLPGQFIEILGRTGEGKSLKTYSMALNCKLQNANVGIFTPELSRHEVKCRVHTLCSAKPEVKKALGLERSFRNRALMFRRGFNLKSYQAFCQYFDEELPGRMHLLSGTGMSDQMSVGYIEDRIVELALDIVFIDPIYLLKPVRYTQEGTGWQEVVWTAEALHRLSEAYNVPIIFTNQSHMDGLSGDAPGKEKSFGGKGMVHLCDHVLGVKHLSDEHRMICRCSKSRFGASHFRYEIGLHANTGVIKELTPVKGSYFNGTDEDADEDDVREMVKTIQKGKG